MPRAKLFKRPRALVFVIWRWLHRSRNLASLKKLKPLVRGFWSCNQPSATAGNFGTSELHPRSRRVLETHYAPPDCRNSPAAFRLPLLARSRHFEARSRCPLSEAKRTSGGGVASTTSVADDPQRTEVTASCCDARP